MSEFFKSHKEIIKDAIIAIAIAAIVLIFIKPVIVSGESMLPNLQDHNYCTKNNCYPFNQFNKMKARKNKKNKGK